MDTDQKRKKELKMTVFAYIAVFALLGAELYPVIRRGCHRA